MARFHFDWLRRRQMVATGLLRHVLGTIVGADPRALRFGRGPHGKPELEGGVVFNLSHSGEWWLLGVADEGRLGVDVEVHRPLAELASLARSTFHPDEAAEVLAHPTPDDRLHAFFRVWARKEAFIKAVGMGLAYPLTGFRVSSAPDADPVLRAIDDPAESVAEWSLRPVSWAPGLAAAIAWDRADVRIDWREIDGAA